MGADKKVSMAVVKRLPRYYRYLSDLLKMGITRISSKELSERMGITASQIRQDLNCFGGFGQQGYGYNVENLFRELGRILGIENRYRTIIIGAGNMGQALANYENFRKRGFTLTGIFDIDEEIIGTEINGVKVMHIDQLEEFVETHKVHIAMITVPHDKTPEVAGRAARAGVKGLWNFSPMDLELPYDVIIENVHLSDSLMVLGYRINEAMGRKESQALKTR